MKNMKYLIKLFGALALTTGAATSVVACYDPAASDVVELEIKYAKLLGLDKVTQVLDDDFSVKIKLDAFDDSTIKPKFEALLKADNTAKDEDSSDFLKELGFKADKKDVYKADDVTTIKALKIVIDDKSADNVKIGTISKKDGNNDFVIGKGSVTFQVKKADTLIKTYKLETADKQDLTVSNLFATFLNNSDKLILDATTGYTQNLPTIGFKLKFKDANNETKYQNLLKTLNLSVAKVTFDWTESKVGLDPAVDSNDKFIGQKEAKVKILFDGVSVINSLKLIVVPNS